MPASLEATTSEQRFSCSIQSFHYPIIMKTKISSAPFTATTRYLSYNSPHKVLTFTKVKLINMVREATI